MVGLNGRSGKDYLTAKGTEHSVTTVRFREAEFHWPLFGNEFEEVTVASVPILVLGSNRKRSMAERVEKSKAVIVTMAPRL